MCVCAVAVASWNKNLIFNFHWNRFCVSRPNTRLIFTTHGLLTPVLSECILRVFQIYKLSGLCHMQSEWNFCNLIFNRPLCLSYTVCCACAMFVLLPALAKLREKKCSIMPTTRANIGSSLNFSFEYSKSHKILFKNGILSDSVISN